MTSGRRYSQDGLSSLRSVTITMDTMDVLSIQRALRNLRARRALGALRVTIAALTLLPACVSPESTRTRGGGPGGDSRNRPSEVRMHEGSQPFYDTPVVIDRPYPDLESAEQARHLSVR